MTAGTAIRAYRNGDIALIRAMSGRLSGRSLYHRFFVGTPHIPVAYLDSLRSVDHRDREVLLALRGDVVAVAEYARDPARPETAELAVLVADAWQRRGLAGPLLDTLGALALSHGITRFTADVLPGNGAARAAILRHRPGSPAVYTLDGTTRYLLETRPRTGSDAHGPFRPADEFVRSA
ncbi:GNAT family N-acetyltransferase [Actinomadura macrotermitis]|uniref:N-acetyltransferase domain-containing protein n=1 Tax=Actinomadura macrotermitis TaxID=2585200 RepID=A0A7K0C0E6_9ACTN|nr:GNAT family N-acetyltransferase [Actinomadura macrotermitis]MQY06938.1 hypothetical protein [Actinomadura macrotermitis]